MCGGPRTPCGIWSPPSNMEGKLNQVVRLSAKHFHPPSHLTGPWFSELKNRIFKAFWTLIPELRLAGCLHRAFWEAHRWDYWVHHHVHSLILFSLSVLHPTFPRHTSVYVEGFLFCFGPLGVLREAEPLGITRGNGLVTGILTQL